MNNEDKEISSLSKENNDANNWKYIKFKNEKSHSRKNMKYDYLMSILMWITLKMENLHQVLFYLINASRDDIIIFGSKIGNFNFISNPDNPVLFVTFKFSIFIVPTFST